MGSRNIGNWFELTGKPLLILLVAMLFLWGVMVFLSMPFWAILIPVTFAVIIILGMVKTLLW